MRLNEPLGLRAVTTWLPATGHHVTEALAQRWLSREEADATGYTWLPVSHDLSPPDMAVLAAGAALVRAGVPAEEISLLLHAWTYHQGHDFWSPAHYVAARLGASRALPIGVQQMCNGAGASVETAASRLLADPSISNALLTTADRFAPPGFDRWRGDYGLWYGDGATAALLSSDATDSDDLHLLAITSTASVDMETMHRGRDEFTPAPRMHSDTVDIRRTKKAFLEINGKQAFAAVVEELVPRLITSALAEAAVKPDEVGQVLLPRLGRTALCAAYVPAVARVLSAPAIDLGDRSGHLGAGDLLANLADAVERDLMPPGAVAVALSAGGGFTWSAAVVQRPAHRADIQQPAEGTVS
ncbi:MAG TPA: ketoacyl-ACP synthase III family protein [Pseudonocardiaceae bacterium]|jgi:3-oxoacyl-[acyl-carrier-protein] synthase-3|nr:ketoacyl-ACP synthase III family protein [Pseudonocardiaceae bacterium]